MQFRALIVDAFRDAMDRKVFWIMLLISGVVAAAMACIGFTDKGVDVLFGMWRHDTSQWTSNNDSLRANIAAVMIEMIADNYLGWIGMIVALVATASVFPSMIEPGAIDIVASKPISRSALFLGRYAGAMVFMAVQAVVFVGLTFLVMGLRWRLWIWSYWWLVPMTVLMFSYLYAFCALFGVVMRRSMTALILTMIVWFMLFGVQAAHAVFESSPDADPSGRWRRLVSAARWAIPKTQDVPLITSKLVGAGDVFEAFSLEEIGSTPQDKEQMREAADAQRRYKAGVDVFASIGSSLAAEGVVILLAMWRFGRRDL